MKKISAKKVFSYLELNELENITFDLVTAKHNNSSLKDTFDIINNNETLKNIFNENFNIEKEDVRIFVIKQFEENLYILKNTENESFYLLNSEEILDYQFINSSKRIFSYDNEVRKVQEFLLKQFDIEYNNPLKLPEYTGENDIIKQVIILRDSYLKKYKEEKINSLELIKDIYNQNSYKLDKNFIFFVKKIKKLLEDKVNTDKVLFEEKYETFKYEINKLKEKKLTSYKKSDIKIKKNKK